MSILRQIIEQDLEAFQANKAKALLNAAILVRRAGLEHLVTEASIPEVEAMALAGEHLADERSARAARDSQDPEMAMAPFDGGWSLENRIMDAALACARRR